MRSRILGVTLTTLLLAPLSGCGDAEFLGKEPPVVISFKNDQPGTSYRPNYELSGFDYNVAERIMGDLDIEYTDRDVASEDRVSVLLEKKSDLVIATFSVAEERLDDIDYAGLYAKTRQGFLVGGPKGAGIKTKKDLTGEPVCTWDGTTSYDTLKEDRENKVDPYTKDDASDCFDDLKSGKAKAVSTDQMILYGFAEHYAQEIDDLRVLADVEGSAQYYGIGIRKQNVDDCERIRDAVEKYVHSSDWESDLQQQLPLIPKHHPKWATEMRPSKGIIEEYSCQN